MSKVKFAGKEFELTGEAYICGTNDNPHYEALATCDGYEYEIIWEIKQGLDDDTEEEDMCDWDYPKIIRQLGTI